MLGRFSDAFDYAGPVAFGLAAWLAACRMTWVMRWIKADDGENGGLDPIG